MIVDMPIPFLGKSQVLRVQDEGAGEEKEKRPGGDLIARLLKTRTVMVSDEVSKKMAQQVMTQLILLEGESNEDIKMFINSPGGDADAGFAIYDMMRFIKPKVKAVCAGVAASAAVIILLGAKKGKPVQPAQCPRAHSSAFHRHPWYCGRYSDRSQRNP